jgi:DNA-binding Lrp family transcriptional regulator
VAARAFILIEAEVGRAKQVAEALRSIDGILSADVVTGTFDVIAAIEAGDIASMAELVTSHVQAVRGVLRTITCVAAG